jgi:hypothetical protein
MKKENIQEIQDNRAQEVEKLSDQDKRVKKICDRVFWGNFVFLFFVAIVAMTFDTYYMGYFGAVFIADIITLPVLFIGYWKVIRKQPIPGWFKIKGGSNWDDNHGFSSSRSFATDPRYSSSPSNTFYRI